MSAVDLDILAVHTSLFLAIAAIYFKQGKIEARLKVIEGIIVLKGRFKK